MDLFRRLQSSVCFFVPVKISPLKNKGLCNRFSNQELLFKLIFYYFVSRLSPLPDASLCQADEWERFWGCLLSEGGRNCLKRFTA